MQWLNKILKKNTQDDEAQIEIVKDLGRGAYEVSYNGKRSTPATVVMTSPRSVIMDL